MKEAGSLDELAEHIATANSAHQPFMQPLLLALDNLGGAAKPADAKREVRRLFGDRISDEQWEYLSKNSRLGWVRFELKSVGALTGPRGVWELTPLAKRYIDAHRDDPIVGPEGVPTLAEAIERQEELENVAVTSGDGFRLPILKVLAEGVSKRQEIMARLKELVADEMLPGDVRQMKSGVPVWRFRAGWALSALKDDGEIENPVRGSWAITTAGRARLDRDASAHSLSLFQNASQNVPVSASMLPAGEDEDLDEVATPDWEPNRWRALRRRIAPRVFDALAERLRPDLGPSPGGRAIPRNIILYGPPGTGKTHVAKLVAEALTGTSVNSEERLWELVQFHPSYAYEDFVQGLRPDLTGTTLLYRKAEGPFLRIARAAAERPDQFFVLLIDEINRGDPARIFGELLYALEYRDEPVVLSGGGELVVPSNLIVIGTMNSVDRSVALVDYALRRRFGFIRLDPDPSVIEAVQRTGEISSIGGVVLAQFNEWIRDRLGADYAVGHSFFIAPALDATDGSIFERLWRLDIRPLMEEYFYGEQADLKEAELAWRRAVTAARRELQEVADEPEAASD